MLDARFHQPTGAKVTRWQCCNCREGGIGRVWSDGKLAGCHNCGQKFNAPDLLKWNLDLRMSQQFQRVRVVAGPMKEWADEMDRLQKDQQRPRTAEQIAADTHDVQVRAAQQANRVGG